MKAFILTLILLGGSLASMAQTVVFAAPHSDMYVPCCKTSLLAMSALKALNTQITLPADSGNRVTFSAFAMVPDKAPSVNGTDRMPVATPQNTDKTMPVIKTDRTGYNMPIVGKSNSTTKPKGRAYYHYKTKDGADSVVMKIK